LSQRHSVAFHFVVMNASSTFVDEAAAPWACGNVANVHSPVAMVVTIATNAIHVEEDIARIVLISNLVPCAKGSLAKTATPWLLAAIAKILSVQIVHHVVRHANPTVSCAKTV